MKFFVFIIIVVALWYVMRWVQQAETARRILRDQQRRTGGGTRPSSRMRTTDTMACPRCGTYVPSEFPISCGRTDCPFPGIG